MSAPGGSSKTEVMRRAGLAVLTSVAIHGALVGAVVTVAIARGLSLGRGVEMVPITIEEVKELPLGSPPAGKAEEGSPAPRPRHRKPRSTGTVAVGNPDAGAAPDVRAAGSGDTRAASDAGRARPRDLRAYGPAGSRLTALLRLDRLRASPDARAYIAAVDEILKLLPDRRLLDGTDLDLFRDFDALLIATPNPYDDTVTFLAAQHHLKDRALQTALDQAAAKVGREIRWTEESGRPVGVRGAAGSRDDRLFVLPQTGLAVIAPPAYARVLLGKSDGGIPPWRDLVARIDAEHGALPEDAVFMMTATNLLRASAKAAAPAAMPQVISAVAGTAPTPFVAITAEFADEAQAGAWETEWPSWKQKLLGNPLVLLAGLNPLVSRAELERDGATIALRTTATSEETRRLLQMIVNFARSGAMP